VVLLAVSVAGVTLSNFYGGLIAAVITPVAIAPTGSSSRDNTAGRSVTCDHDRQPAHHRRQAELLTRGTWLTP
jgi:hypothetical protein